MNLDFTPEYQAFRAEVRDFLETHKESAPRMSDRGVRSEKEKRGRKFCWTRLCRPHIAEGVWRLWRAPDALKSRIIAEEFSRAKIPGGISGQGINMLVPTLLELGTEEQKQKYIEPTLTGEMVWCQGYSDPVPGLTLPLCAHRRFWRAIILWSTAKNMDQHGGAGGYDFCWCAPNRCAQASGHQLCCFQWTPGMRCAL